MKVGEEVQLVCLGLQDQVVCGRMEGMGWGASAPVVCKIAKWWIFLQDNNLALADKVCAG